MGLRLSGKKDEHWRGCLPHPESEEKQPNMGGAEGQLKTYTHFASFVLADKPFPFPELRLPILDQPRQRPSSRADDIDAFKVNETPTPSPLK